LEHERRREKQKKYTGKRKEISTMRHHGTVPRRWTEDEEVLTWDPTLPVI
jgi:hypothetical protein